MVSKFDGKITTSEINTSKLNYLSGVTTDIQTQFDDVDLNKASRTDVYTKSQTTNQINTTIAAVPGMVDTLSNMQAQITGGSDTATALTALLAVKEPVITLDASKVIVSDVAGKISASSTITTANLDKLSNVTSNIQNQLDAKQNKFTLTGGYVMVTNDTTGDVEVSNTTKNEVAYLSGLTSNIQAQLNNKQAGAALSINEIMITDVTGDLATSGISKNKLNFLSDVTSNIQAQFSTIYSDKANIVDVYTSVQTDNAISDAITGAPGLLDTLHDMQTALASNNDPVAALTILVADKQDILTLDNNKAMITTASGAIDVSDVTNTELSYLNSLYPLIVLSPIYSYKNYSFKINLDYLFNTDTQIKNDWKMVKIFLKNQ
jgi:lysophospholipase L1-like esterase